MNIIVSACLLGINSRYNGDSSNNEHIKELLKHHNLIPVCPEQLGGMPTPRYPSEVLAGSGTVKNSHGEEVTSCFIKGAEEALKIAHLYSCKHAILKSKSPSCGYGLIYDGTFSGKLIKGNGFCAEMFVNDGIIVYTENDELPF